MTAVDRGDVRATAGHGRHGHAALLYDPRVRGIFFQLVAVAVLVFVGYVAISNAVENLREQGIASGFDFLDEVAGFDISQSLIPYKNTYSYGRAFVVGLLNTILVAAIGIVIATILGFIIGIMRLSGNWLLRQIATAYIEILRNIPLLVQLFFWYFAILKNLPSVRNSIGFGFGTQLNIRGVYLPAIIFEPGAELAGIMLIVAIAATIVLARWAKHRQDRTGERFPTFLAGLGLIVGLPLVGLVIAGFPMTMEYPELRGFNFVGGINVNPEFAALLLGLSLYTAAFVAEIVRGGVLAVNRGQTEASYALGLRPNMALRLVIVPQAMRIIVPPLTNQYLNLTKNSSLAVAIGYPDLVSVFAGTVLNQTGQAVEIILVTMGVYLSLSLLTSVFMNWFNSRIALVER